MPPSKKRRVDEEYQQISNNFKSLDNSKHAVYISTGGSKLPVKKLTTPTLKNLNNQRLLNKLKIRSIS